MSANPTLRGFSALGFTVGILCAALLILQIFDSNEPELHEDILEHFKYGSIGAEERAGVPWEIWRVLPTVFPEHLPDRPGEGYARFGMVYESETAERPIGTSYRERQVPLQGLNCAVCHTGVLRDSPEAPRQIILGMPSHQMDLQAYQEFLFACGRDPRFTTDTILSAIRKANPDFGFFDRLIYRFLVIPRTRDGIQEAAEGFTWTQQRPPQGPGRVDTFNPYKAIIFGFDMSIDLSVGTADLPSLWDQKSREGLSLHWDGNNNSVAERNLSAAIGAGASEDSLDLAAIKRVEDWIWDLKPPPFPSDRIDTARAAAGEPLYRQHCATCHAIGSEFVGKVIEIDEIGTDPERMSSFTEALAERMNTLGTGRPWRFSHFRSTNGYAAMPLDGLWLRAPYLHNGSVPTLQDLLKPVDERPAVFWRGYEVYDYDKVGFVSQGAGAEAAGFRFDASLRGNGRQGHLYGTELDAGQKQDLLEYLKTL